MTFALTVGLLLFCLIGGLVILAIPESS